MGVINQSPEKTQAIGTMEARRWEGSHGRCTKSTGAIFPFLNVLKWRAHGMLGSYPVMVCQGRFVL